MSLSELSVQRNLVGWVRAALLTMVVFGIVGMHGLAAHCSPSGSHSTQMTIVSTGSLIADRAEPSVMGAPAGDAGRHQAQAPGEGTGDHDLGMVGICIVALAGLALALSMVFVRRSRTLWRVPPRLWLSVPRPRSRLPRPPTLAELSLLRC